MKQVDVVVDSFEFAIDSLTKFDQEFAVAFSLVRWHRQNARDIVVFGALFLLGKIADDVKAAWILFGHNVKQKWICVVIERFVIEKQFGEQT